MFTTLLFQFKSHNVTFCSSASLWQSEDLTADEKHSQKVNKSISLDQSGEKLLDSEDNEYISKSYFDNKGFDKGPGQFPSPEAVVNKNSFRNNRLNQVGALDIINDLSKKLRNADKNEKDKILKSAKVLKSDGNSNVNGDENLKMVLKKLTSHNLNNISPNSLVSIISYMAVSKTFFLSTTHLILLLFQLYTLKSLQYLEIPLNSYLTQSIQNSLIWKCRSCSIQHLENILGMILTLTLKSDVNIYFSFENVDRVIIHYLYSLGYSYKNRKNSEMSEKLFNEAIRSVQMRWVEFSEPEDFVTLMNFSEYFSDTLIAKLEDQLTNQVENLPSDTVINVRHLGTYRC